MRELVNAIPEWGRVAQDGNISDDAWGKAGFSVMEVRHSVFADWVNYARQ